MSTTAQVLTIILSSDMLPDNSVSVGRRYFKYESFITESLFLEKSAEGTPTESKISVSQISDV